MKAFAAAGLLATIPFAPMCFAEHCLPLPHPICGAVSRGDIDATTRLLDGDPKLIEQGVNGYNLLTLAALAGQKDMVIFLTSRGIDLNSMTLEGGTTLHILAVCGRKNMAGFFLDKGGDIDALDRKGRSALEVAASIGQLEMARFLRTRGAKVDIFSAAAL